MGVQIHELFEEFNQLADSSKHQIQDILSVISEGKVPDNGLVDTFGFSIHALQDKYDSIYAAAKEQLEEDEMPLEGSAAEDYVAAVNNSKSVALQKYKEKAYTLLQSFLKVQSLIKAYAEALAPFQKQAESLLVSIQSIPEIKDIEQLTIAPTIFMEALFCDDLDSEEGMEILDYVGDYYPSRVQNGLAARKYYIPEEKNDKHNSSEKILSIGVDSKPQTENHNSIPEGVFEVSLDESIGDENIIDITDISPDDSLIDEGIDFDRKNLVEDIEESAFIKRINDSRLVKEEPINIGPSSIEKSDGETKKVSASIFKNDIRKGNEKALKEILKEVAKKNYVTKRFLGLMINMPDVLASSSLEYLYRKGYLRRYKILSNEEFYGVSPRLIEALLQREAAKMIGLRQRSFEDWGVTLVDEFSSVACHSVYNTLYCDTIQRFMDDGFFSFSETASLFHECFLNRVEAKNDDIVLCDYAFGAFWTKTNDCNKYLEDVKEILLDPLTVRTMIVSSFDQDKAKQLASILLEEIGKTIPTERIYLYSLKDGKYYSYTDGIEINLLDNSPNEGQSSTSHGNVGDYDNNDLSSSSLNDEFKKEGPENDTKELDAEISVSSRESDHVQMIIKSDTHQVEKAASPISPLDPNTFKKNLMSMINEGRVYAATAYANAFSIDHPDYKLFYNQLAHAVNDPMGTCNYSTDNVFTLIDQEGEFEDAMVISTAIRTFFSNQIHYDYNIKSYYSGIKEYKILNDYPNLSTALFSLMSFKDKYQKGMDAYADYRSRSKSELDDQLHNLQQEAKLFYENTVIGFKKERAKQKRFLDTKKMIFSADSDFGIYIKTIVDGEKEAQSLVLEFLKEEFFREDSTIGIDTIDNDMLLDYIMVYWDKAGEGMTYYRRANLMSQLRSNIVSTTKKAVQLLVRWCDLVERISDHEEDEGSIAYKKERNPLIDILKSAVNEIQDDIDNRSISIYKEAGNRILINTLNEILDCVDGAFIEDSKRYFHIPFLLTGDVMLDEDYLPDLSMHSSTIPSLNPMVRISEHVYKMNHKQPSFQERLTEILDDKGDDYGAARLIVDYLRVTEPSEEWDTISSTIESGEAYAKETADLRKDDFIGNLELAQSYGQIDNSVEDKKEKILQIVDEWYEWAVESSNYGFFNKVMEKYLVDIKEEAKTREKDLLEQLDAYRNVTVPGLSADAKEKRSSRIKKMINEQNYTVAEDLLARFNVLEEDHEELIEEDYLQDFIDNYDDYYRPVSSHSASFANLVSRRTRNKEQRGAKRLADNWLPGGSELGKDRLENLLNSLGFKVSSIEKGKSINKFEHFKVKTEKAKGGQRDNYTHPIAAFGSGAAREGFRVICINGAYGADRLIEIMKEIGNAMHTMILYDNALPMSERRRLARKTKNSLGDKLFAVVDRTVMMFLVRNYDETRMNKMLVSLITPFGYYQPYVWESANVMPPEIFMGRKNELERIKSPTGVNIVYGGRQLGKSALLKKAKEDIDWDENGNRAVLVDIKGRNYKEAAKKIAGELYDAGVLDQDLDTEDWNELARAVRRRLQSEKDRIPYLLLLIDEADVFIESCEDVNYQPFDALKDIQSIGTGRFKFVIAGLRNIVRFKREALGNNSVLTHLEPMTVKPFNTSEARELMEAPLHYLGLRFPKEKEFLITLILASTNYFPGLIQMYCAKLINAMRNKDYANYDEVDSPIYEVSEDHIKKVLADPEFMQQIREKYIITLELGDDNYYYLIALLMAFLYHNNGYNDGYSADDIKDAGTELEISKIANLETTKLTSFMEELKELNVLRSTDETHYLFTRFTFFQMMGTRDEVDNKLEEYMGE